MEIRKLIEIFRATIDPQHNQEAEAQLEQIKKIIGFAPSLLQLVMMNEVDLPIRQAAAIYLKNYVSEYWADHEPPTPGATLQYSIHEQDRAMIRDSVVEAVVLAPDLIKTHLCTCVGTLVKNDFPGRWTQIVDKINIYLTNPDPNGWNGALLCLLRLVKHYEYRKPNERAPLHEAMVLLLPLMYQLMVRLMSDQSEQSVLLQKQILKTYYALTQYMLPVDLISKEMFAQWMEVCRQVIERPVPPEALQPDEDERPDLSWWKCKKWASHILSRMFERYGSPGLVLKEYNEFAEWYLKTFSNGIMEVLLRQLDAHRNGHWVAPRVLQQTLHYLTQGVSHAYTWAILKPHMQAIIQEIVFPLMCYSAEDHQLWTTDPQEYIRVKFDVFEDFVSPVSAAKGLLYAACKKRKEMLDKTMSFVMHILNNPNSEAAQRDGALHMVGSLADVMLRKKLYRDQLDQLLINYVFPVFNSDRGHMRARACWTLHYFATSNFQQEAVIVECINLTVRCLLQDNEFPVKVEAAIALQSLLNFKEDKCQKYLEPQVKAIALELLNLIRETESEDVSTVMQKLVFVFTEQLTPMAVEICQHLADTFGNVLKMEENADDKVVAGMGILNTIESLLSVMEEQPEVLLILEPIVIQVIVDVLQKGVHEFYEEVLALIYDLTSKHITEQMWFVLPLIHKAFAKDGIHCFVDMMPAIHNYLTVDTDAFLRDPNNLDIIFNMCKDILVVNKGYGEDAESHAAKLLEVVLLQCQGKVDQQAPMIVELAAERLLQEVKTSELRTMCLQVLIAALLYNPNLLFSVLEKVPNFTDSFVKQWLQDTDCFLGIHDRKVCVLGLCTLIALEQKPRSLIEMAPKVVPSLILLFDGLKRAYAARAQEQADDDSENSDGDSEDGNGVGDSEEDARVTDVLSSDEDEIDDEGAEYLEKLQKRAIKECQKNQYFNDTMNETLAAVGAGDSNATGINDDEDDEDSDYDPNEETMLESFTTPLDEATCTIDEYEVFKQVMSRLETTQPEWYNALTVSLNDQQKRSLVDICVLADQRKAAKESKLIEQQGGYVFTQHEVPTSFKFGGNKNS